MIDTINFLKQVSTACRWFQPHNHPNIDTMATASTTYPTAKDSSISPQNRSAPVTVTPTNGLKNGSGVKNGTSCNGNNSGNKECPKSLNHVNFGADGDNDIQDRKKKYLTAKYGQHQMNLIKKRLRVEMWMYEQLALLYDTNVSVDMELN